MAVITISREIGSQGEQIAQQVAQTLGYHFADKHTMDTVLSQYGLVEFQRIYDTEQGYWARLDATYETTVKLLNDVINALARHGNVVILGRGSFALLHGYIDVLNVRIRAPLDVRVRRVMQEKNLMDFDEAMAFVRRQDKIRTAFVESTYGLRWEGTAYFDLVVDTSKIAADRAATWLCEAIEDLPAMTANVGASASAIAVDETLGRSIATVLNCESIHAPSALPAG